MFQASLGQRLAHLIDMHVKMYGMEPIATWEACMSHGIMWNVAYISWGVVERHHCVGTPVQVVMVLTTFSWIAESTLNSPRPAGKAVPSFDGCERGCWSGCEGWPPPVVCPVVYGAVVLQFRIVL